jgi:hypothetical protein
MSRARYIDLSDDPADRIWFDTHRDGEKARAAHLEALALVEEIDIDDLLDGHVTQKEVIIRLRSALGQGGVPEEIRKRRKQWKKLRLVAPQCRICEKKGDSTKHHFVNKWILRELRDYAREWSDRSVNTIPVCINCHRDLHERDGPAKSIIEYLTTEERDFAWRALNAFCTQHPKMAMLIARGDDSVYEARLMKDFIIGLLNPVEEPIVITPAIVRESAGVA